MYFWQHNVGHQFVCFGICQIIFFLSLHLRVKNNTVTKSYTSSIVIPIFEYLTCQFGCSGLKCYYLFIPTSNRDHSSRLRVSYWYTCDYYGIQVSRLNYCRIFYHHVAIYTRSFIIKHLFV